MKWFGVGALLWGVAVLLKIPFSFTINQAVVGRLMGDLPQPLFSVAVGLFLGIESSAFEIGLTWLAARRWPALGRDAGRAITVSIGAGSVEAFLLGSAVLAAWLAVLAGAEDATEFRPDMQSLAAATPLFWLLPFVERCLTMLGHSSTRALVLLGTAKRRPWLVFLGFALFALIDGIGSAFIVGGVKPHSSWWVELAILPATLLGAPILIWCYRSWPDPSSYSGD